MIHRVRAGLNLSDHLELSYRAFAVACYTPSLLLVNQTLHTLTIPDAYNGLDSSRNVEFEPIRNV